MVINSFIDYIIYTSFDASCSINLMIGFGVERERRSLQQVTDFMKSFGVTASSVLSPNYLLCLLSSPSVSSFSILLMPS